MNNSTKTGAAQAQPVKTATKTLKEIMDNIYCHGGKIIVKAARRKYRQLTPSQYTRYIDDACKDTGISAAFAEQLLDEHIVDGIYARYGAAPDDVQDLDGGRILVTHGTDWIQPTDAPPLAGISAWLDAARGNKLLATALAGCGDDRMIILAAWIAQARARVRAWLATMHGIVDQQIPVLVLTGAEGCGKSVIISRVLAPLIAGWDPDADAPTPPVAAGRALTGRFNAEIIQSCLLSIDDEISGLTTRERERLFTACKSICYAQTTAIEAKGQQAYNARIPWAIVIACNASDAALQAIPYTADEPNKLIVLNIQRRAPLPENWQTITRADAQAAANLIDALPALLAHDSRNRVIADPLGRQGVAGFVDPLAARGIMAVSPEGVMARIWLDIYQRADSAGIDAMDNYMRVSDVYRMISEQARARDQAAWQQACPTPRACGRLLRSLVRAGLATSKIDRSTKNPMYYVNAQAIKADQDKGGELVNPGGF